MMLPLPRNRTHRRDISTGHAGLIWDKFFDRWQEDGNHYSAAEEKGEWIKQFCGKPIGCKTALQNHASRREELITKSKGQTKGKTHTFKNTSRLVTGMGYDNPVENGFLWHHTLGVPYLPGSTIKGMIRAWADHWEGAKDHQIKRLFGNTDQQGTLIVFDAIPTAPVKMVCEIITQHNGTWRQDGPPNAPADWNTPVPIPFLAMESGHNFQFALALTDQAQTKDLEAGFKLMQDALEWIGAGGKTAIGMGRFLTVEEYETRKQDAIEERKRAQKAAEEAAKNWTPSIGDVVFWTDASEDVKVLSINNAMAEVQFLDDDDTETVSLSQLKRK